MQRQHDEWVLAGGAGGPWDHGRGVGGFKEVSRVEHETGSE